MDEMEFTLAESNISDLITEYLTFGPDQHDGDGGDEDNSSMASI